MTYLALLTPAVALACLPLIDRLERWASFSRDRVAVRVEPANADLLLTRSSSGELR